MSVPLVLAFTLHPFRELNQLAMISIFELLHQSTHQSIRNNSIECFISLRAALFALSTYCLQLLTWLYFFVNRRMLLGTNRILSFDLESSFIFNSLQFVHLNFLKIRQSYLSLLFWFKLSLVLLKQYLVILDLLVILNDFSLAMRRKNLGMCINKDIFSSCLNIILRLYTLIWSLY